MSALEWLDSLQGSGIRPGLGRIRAILRRLGNPHRAVPSIIIAGTNGKGSTSATLNSILLESGYRTGMYTSPHLVDIRERWLIGGQPITEELFEESIETLRRAAANSGIPPTYFEALTIIAFIAFERAHCEIAVLEVGMGGRLDATNVVRPIAAVITPIGLDHTEFLGNTIRKIAGEKAGVIHRAAVVLTSNHDPTILSVLEKRAARFDNRFHIVRGDEAGDVPLAGDFQRLNVSLAIRAAEELRERLPRITPDSIVRGVAKTRWRGRLERIRIADKDVAGVTSLLFPMFDEVIVTDPYPPRNEPSARLAAIAKDLGVRVTAVPQPSEAMEKALASSERTIFVGGSLYLAGAAIAYLDALRDE